MVVNSDLRGFGQVSGIFEKVVELWKLRNFLLFMILVFHFCSTDLIRTRKAVVVAEVVFIRTVQSEEIEDSYCCAFRLKSVYECHPLSLNVTANDLKKNK